MSWPDSSQLTPLWIASREAPAGRVVRSAVGRRPHGDAGRAPCRRLRVHGHVHHHAATVGRESADAVRAGPVSADELATGGRERGSGRRPRHALGAVRIQEIALGAGHVRPAGQLLPVVQGHGARARAAQVPVAEVGVAVALLVDAVAGRFDDPARPGHVQPARLRNGQARSRHQQRVDRGAQGHDLAIDEGEPTVRLEGQPVDRLRWGGPGFAGVVRPVGGLEVRVQRRIRRSN